ncbi:hypothetical protein GCM10010274_06580 [Streptomyces lavendofoliae]|uniref:Uncharacterized protein n=1 Tax=Streptomyces lavendofoliae TaxID=67314 RepID=A0A918HUF4_9ACTN|nr:hypothetical protein GCM10010274_06580 [Streptomyces lavendofoliae]
MASVRNRCAVGPDRPIDSIAAIPASTAGDSAVAEAWKTSTRTSAPPGGEGKDNVVRAPGPGSPGLGPAVAGVPLSREAARAPAASAAAAPRRVLDR